VKDDETVHVRVVNYSIIQCSLVSYVVKLLSFTGLVVAAAVDYFKVTFRVSNAGCWPVKMTSPLRHSNVVCSKYRIRGGAVG